MENKEEILKALLENQKLNWTLVRKDQKKQFDQMMNEVEPFSWMDETVKAALANKLSEEEMNNLDKCARANIVGQKIMANALVNALKK